MNFGQENPTPEDFNNAHRKACFKEEPHPPESEDDEMRDLVIWELALRLARENGGAILLSRDKVHIHHRGDREAAQFGLKRFNDLDRASEALELETTSAQVITRILSKVWKQVIASDLPLVEGAQILSIKQPTFRNAEDGTISVKAEVSMNTGKGNKLNATLMMRYVKEVPFYIEFSQIRLDKQSEIAPVKLEFSKPPSSENSFSENMDKLRNVIGG